MHFQKTLLSQQVADRLAAELRSGAWQNNLPSERKLEAFFGVSRRTIRAALAILARAKMLQSVAGHRAFVAVPRSRSAKSADKVVVLMVSAVKSSLVDFCYWMVPLRHYVALAGYTLQIEIMPAKVNLQHWLEKICNEYHAAAWLLTSLNKDVQRWFERRGLPSLVLGTCHEGVHLAEIDIDYRAVCRHAAQTLLRLGHRRIVFINVDSGFAGDLASERGFREGIAAYAPGTVKAQIVRHKGGVDRIGYLLNRLFDGTEPPSAIIVSASYYAMAVMGHLARMGKRIPEDVSVICRDNDPLFEFVVPYPAYYRVDMDLFARRTMRMIVRIDQCSIASAAPVRIIPKFIPGKSIAVLRRPAATCPAQ